MHFKKSRHFYFAFIIYLIIMFSRLSTAFRSSSKQFYNLSTKQIQQFVKNPVRTFASSSSSFAFKRRLYHFTRNAKAVVFATAMGGILAYSSTQAISLSEGFEDRFESTALFPPISAYEKGMLQVSEIHSIAYSIYGNPKGKPVIFVHGGPGGGTDPVMARYFDPAVYKIILVDQRGCGDSVPFADLRENTTYDSVRDFEKLRIKLGIDKWQVFGGSWGSTLALAYAVSHFLLFSFP